MSQRWPQVERGQLKRSKEGRAGGNLNFNSTVTNDKNKKRKAVSATFSLSIGRKSQGKRISLKLILAIKVIVSRH